MQQSRLARMPSGTDVNTVDQRQKINLRRAKLSTIENGGSWQCDADNAKTWMAGRTTADGIFRRT
jgi:hypothetical protein